MLEPINAITVCVEYADLLALTLPWNQFFWSRIVVVTSPEDEQTIELCRKFAAEGLQVHCHQTNAFYARKAKFNKWAALEEGLDVLGRDGWILIHDADIAIQPCNHPFQPQIGRLYTPIRHVMKDISKGVIPATNEWRKHKPMRLNEEFNGYFQLFHANDPVLGPAPWHSVDWTWAGGGDTEFHKKWPDKMKTRPPFRCLHLGPTEVNWCGRSTPFVDGTLPAEAHVRFEQSQIIKRARRDRRHGFHGDRYKGAGLDPEN
jgi:hypothetical protein